MNTSCFTSRPITTISDDDMMDDMMDDICFTNAPVDSALVENFTSDIPASEFLGEGNDDNDLIPLHLLWDPSESTAFSTGYKFTYDPAVPAHELEDDGGDVVNDVDEEDINIIDFSGELRCLVHELDSDNS